MKTSPEIAENNKVEQTQAQKGRSVDYSLMAFNDHLWKIKNGKLITEEEFEIIQEIHKKAVQKHIGNKYLTIKI